jgi:hypothetical protein
VFRLPQPPALKPQSLSGAVLCPHPPALKPQSFNGAGLWPQPPGLKPQSGRPNPLPAAKLVGAKPKIAMVATTAAAANLNDMRGFQRRRMAVSAPLSIIPGRSAGCVAALAIKVKPQGPTVPGQLNQGGAELTVTGTYQTA